MIFSGTGTCLFPFLMLYLIHPAEFLGRVRPRRSGRAAECRGLLILPALFVLTDFDSFG